MVSVVVVEFSVMRCQPLRRALYALAKDSPLHKEKLTTKSICIRVAV